MDIKISPETLYSLSEKKKMQIQVKENARWLRGRSDTPSCPHSGWPPEEGTPAGLTGSPDALCRRGHAAVEALVPLPEQPVHHLPLLVHHHPLDFVHVGIPVIHLEKTSPGKPLTS